MNKLMNLSVAGLVGLCATANAKTIAWYRFDDAQVGTKANGQSAFLNAVDPAKYPGYFRTWKPAPSAPWNYPPVITDGESEYYPDYTNAFPSSVHILDPLSNTLYANDTALRVNNAQVDSASAAGAILMVDDHEDLHLRTFTIEFYLRILPEVTGNSWRYILQKPTAGGMMISLFLQNAAYLYCSLQTSGGKYTQNTGAVAVNDGKWHHVAIVVDDATKTYKFITDKIVKSVAYAGELDYDGAGAMCFCNSSTDYFGSWQGGIDEIRISDVALPTSEMLTLVEGPSDVSTGVTPGTLLYVDFEGSSVPATYNELASGISPDALPEALWNKALKTSPLKSHAVINYVTSATRPKVLETGWFTADVPYGQSRAGLAATNFAANAAVFHSGTNAAANGEKMSIARLEVADAGRILFSDSFTLEFDLRIGTGPIEMDGGAFAYIMMQTGAFTIRCNILGRIYVSDGEGKKFVFSRSYNSTDNTLECYNDGKWHHLVLVYDKSTAKGLFYIDGELRATRADANFFGTQDDDVSKNLCVLGGHWGGSYRFNNADVDSLRIVRGALRPYQFLTTRVIESTNLGYAAFDGDYVISPYADLFKPAMVSGAAFATDRPAGTILDGKDGEPVRERNTRSVALSGGSVTWEEHDIITDSEKVTAEFFVKTQTAGAPLLAVGDIWSLDSSLTLAVGAESAAPEGAAGLADGKWHHVAVAFDGAAAKVYLDYEVALEHVFASAPATAKAADLVLGGEGFTGNLDELRFTPSVLAPTQFLWAERHGMVLLVR